MCKNQLCAQCVSGHWISLSDNGNSDVHLLCPNQVCPKGTVSPGSSRFVTIPAPSTSADKDFSNNLKAMGEGGGAHRLQCWKEFLGEVSCPGGRLKGKDLQEP